MTAQTLVIALAVSFLGTLVASGLALLPFKESQRISNVVLFLSTVMGVGLGAVVATSGSLTLAFPFDLGETVSPFFFNMNFMLDRFAGIFYALVNGVAMLTALYAVAYAPAVSSLQARRVTVLLGLLIFSLQGILLASNIVGFVFFWELASLLLFFLIMVGRSKAARQAAVLYLFISQLAAAAITAGLFVLSGGALLSTFSLIAYSASALTSPILAVSVVLLTVGFAATAGLVPFHVWLPEAQVVTPPAVGALLLAAVPKVAIYGFLRVILFMIPGVPAWLPIVVLILGLLSAIFGALYTIMERDGQRILAFSTVTNVGLIFTFIAVALFAANNGNEALMQATLFAALFQALAHAVGKAGLSTVFATLAIQLEVMNLEHLGGLARRMPQLSLIACVLILALAALPPFAPFVAQWTFIQAVVGGLSAATLPLMVALLVGLAGVTFVGGLSSLALVKLYAVTFLGEPRSEQAAQAKEPRWGLLLPSLLSAAALLFGGLLAPKILSSLGATSLVVTNSASGFIRVDGGSLLPLGLTVVFAALLALIFLLRYVVSNPDFERQAVAWTGGQASGSRLTFTATSFSGPARYFFRFLLRTQKELVVTPLIATNPWITRTRFQLTVSSVWYERLYRPLSSGLMWLANIVRKVQSGSIQVYVGFIALALVLALIIAL